MSRKSQVQLQAIALQGTDRDYPAIAINLLQPGTLMKPEEMLFLEIPRQLNLQQGIILYGQAPMWLYSHLVSRFHQAPWVGCYDIHSQAAIVVFSKAPHQKAGDKLPIVFHKSPGSAILIGGPPDSGKSVFSNRLRVELAAKRPELQIYLHRANWDGEGNHTYENSDRHLAKKLKKESKRKIHLHPNADELLPKYFDYHAKATANIRQVVDLALVDVGGKPERVKMPVVQQCSHYIIISKDSERIPEWHHLCGTNLQPLAVIHSVLENRLEVLKTEPFLEIVAGPWLPEKTHPVPDVLLQEVLKVLP